MGGCKTVLQDEEERGVKGEKVSTPAGGHESLWKLWGLGQPETGRKNHRREDKVRKK